MIHIVGRNRRDANKRAAGEYSAMKNGGSIEEYHRTAYECIQIVDTFNILNNGTRRYHR